MRIPAINEPLRLGLPFGVLYIGLAVPSLWILQPWTWDGPLISKMAGVLLPPFLVGIVLYASVLFVVSLTANFRAQRQALAEFLVAVVAPAAILFATWVYSGYRNVPSMVACSASFTAYSLLYRMQRKRRRDIR